MIRPHRLAAKVLLPVLAFSTLLFAQDKTATKTASKPTPAAANKLPLREGWALQTSAKVEAKGEAISTPKFNAQGWHQVAVPTTVVAALIKDKTLPEPFSGMNLRNYPGMNYPIGANFSNIAMAADSPYAVSWWYRKTFTIPASDKGKTIWLNFKGINYRANIFLNGKQIATDSDIAGAWRTYEFNITPTAKPGEENVLAVQAFSPTEHDLAITFVDWNPAPPDKNMGLWREVYVTTSGPAALRYPTVVSKLSSPANDSAQLTVTAQVKNGTSQPVKGKLKGQIENITFEQDVELGPNEAKDVTFAPDKFSQLVFTAPRLWWPKQMGKPDLYPLENGIRSQWRRSARNRNPSSASVKSPANSIPSVDAPVSHQRQEHPDPRRRMDS